MEIKTIIVGIVIVLIILGFAILIRQANKESKDGKFQSIKR